MIRKELWDFETLYCITFMKMTIDLVLCFSITGGSDALHGKTVSSVPYSRDHRTSRGSLVAGEPYYEWKSGWCNVTKVSFHFGHDHAVCSQCYCLFILWHDPNSNTSVKLKFVLLDIHSICYYSFRWRSSWRLSLNDILQSVDASAEFAWRR